MGESFKSKMPFYEASALAEELTLLLKERGVERVAVCGSVRRMKPEVGDLDLVVIGDLSVVRSCPTWRYADGGNKKCTVEYKGRQVNILRTTPESLGAAVLYFTGNSTFNCIMRRKAKRMGLKLNEYGLWRGEVNIASRSEADIFEALNMKWHDPTERSK